MRILSTSHYIDKQYFELEQEHIFKKHPIYMGCKQMVPELGNYFVCQRNSGNVFLIHNASGVEVISNICRHHQALILENAGKINKITCPFHFWQYDLAGTLRKAPNFPGLPCIQLDKTVTHSWENLLFKNQPPAIEIKKKSLLTDFSFEAYRYHNSAILPAAYNWKIFIDNYLDDYHIPAIHPGLKNLVDLNNLEWEFSLSFSAQRIGIKNKILQSTSEHFNGWKNLIQEIEQSNIQPKAASVMWILIYPGTMIEVYPYMLTVSTLTPISCDETINHVDFFYPNFILDNYPEYPDVSQSSYFETAKEDDKICTAIQHGREELFKQKQNDSGWLQPKLEAGINQFHEFWFNAIQHAETQ